MGGAVCGGGGGELITFDEEVKVGVRLSSWDEGFCRVDTAGEELDT